MCLLFAFPASPYLLGIIILISILSSVGHTVFPPLLVIIPLFLVHVVVSSLLDVVELSGV